MASSSSLGTPHLSRRGDENIGHNVHWRIVSEALHNVYDKEKNPDGAVNLGLSESNLMHEEVRQHLAEHITVDPTDHLTYGSGPIGSPRLQSALAAFYNQQFAANPPTKPGEWIVGPGVSSLLESMSWMLCNEGDGILVPQPLYTGFEVAMLMRSRAKLLPVSFADEGSSGDLDPAIMFDAAANAKALEAALARHAAAGSAARAVMLCHPHNPLGRCYPAETVREIARFCARHDLHLISDEIYALSTFANAAAPHAEPFRSVLAIDLADVIAPNMVHVLYGMSKDFCANGLRVGALHTRWRRLWAAMGSVAAFGWPSYLVQDACAAMLEDRPFVDRFVHENSTRLATAHANIARALDARGVPFYRDGNAGFFVWINLSARLPGFRDPNLDPKEARERQGRFVAACIANGVFIRDGYLYFAERPGWFRLTFTLDNEELELGLDRMLKTIDQFAADEKEKEKEKGAGA